MDNFVAGVLMVLIGLPIFFAGMVFCWDALRVILNGWALHLLWGWFFVPIFNAPSLSIAQAIAVAMVVSFLTYQPTKTDDTGVSAALLFIRPFLAVLIGLVVKQFI